MLECPLSEVVPLCIIIARASRKNTIANQFVNMGKEIILIIVSI